MGPKSIRDSGSPSASSFLHPQLRHSRRGSLASLSSTHQLDKEALSLALDQIHNTASQTETLTTFNEYTSPPTSSSGPDTKGIASELHGGLSGLYNRFRASVGNVKDIVNPGGEDVVVENAPVKSPRAATYSPKPLSKNAFESARDISSSNSTTRVTSAAGSGRQSPQGIVDTGGEHQETRQSSKPSAKSLGSASASAKSGTGSLVVLKSPPATLIQAAQLTTISPALADVNISAVKRVDASQDLVSAARNVIPAEPQRLARSSQRPSYLTEASAQGDVDVSKSTPSDKPVSRTASQVDPKQKGGGPVSNDASNALNTPDKPEIVGLRTASTDSVRPFPELEGDIEETAYDATGSASDLNNTQQDKPPTVVTSHAVAQGDIFSAPNINNTGGTILGDVATTGAGHQHTNLPLRKTMAPPLITRSHSPNLSGSRVSTSDTESLDNSPLPAKSRKPPTRLQGAPPTQSINPQHLALAANQRSTRPMNVFSQLKNKVLNKEYWMKDENARDCFYCGESFSTFRRKHHCSESTVRICIVIK